MWEQWLTSLSIWFQFPIVFLVVLPLSALGALGFTKAVDAIGVWVERQVRVRKNPDVSKQRTKAEITEERNGTE